MKENVDKNKNVLVPIISLKNEVSVWEYIHKLMTEKLKLFQTTLEEDEQLIELDKSKGLE